MSGKSNIILLTAVLILATISTPSFSFEINNVSPTLGGDVSAHNELANVGDAVNIARLIPSGTPLNAGVFRGVSVVDNYAYVTTRDGGYLLVYKLDEILNAHSYIGDVHEISYTDISGGGATTIARKGNYLYVGTYSSMSVIDVSDREKPHEVKVINYGSYRSMKVVDNYLITLGGINSNYIFNISDPASPVYQNTFGMGRDFADATIYGNYLYAAEWITGSGIRIYDISNISDVLELNYIAFSEDHLYHIDVMQGHLFAVTDVWPGPGSQLFSYSLSDPAGPVLLDSLSLSVGGRAFGIASQFCVLAGGGDGHIVDIRNASSMNIIGDIHDQGGTGDGFPFDVAVVDDLILLGGQEHVLASQINIPLFEESDPAIKYTGTWNSLVCNPCKNGLLKYSGQTGARAEFSFYGTGIRWHTAKAPVLGKAKIYFDGAYKGMIDLYRSTVQYPLVLGGSGIPAGNHTLTIEVSGQKNSGSSGNYVLIDAFEVVP